MKKNKLLIIIVILLTILIADKAIIALKTCPHCHYENNSDSREYCLNCAAQLKESVICPFCQSQNTAKQIHCINCGHIINKKIDPEKKLIKKNKSTNQAIKKKDYRNSEKRLLKKFQKDFRENRINKYSINDLLKLKSMDSTVDVFVKKGTKTSTSIPNGPTIISIATVDHYKAINIKDAILNILRKKIKKNPGIKHQIFAALSNPNPLIKASAAISCCYIDSLRDYPSLDSKLIYLLKDSDSFVKKTALSLILRPQSKAIKNTYLFEIVIKILNNSKLDKSLRESAIFGLYQILKHYKDCIKKHKRNTKTIQSIQNRISDLQSSITLSKKNRKQTNYYNNKAKDKFQKQIKRNTVMLNDEKNRLKIISKTTDSLKKIANNYPSYFSRTEQTYKQIIKKSTHQELKKAATNALENLKLLS